MQDAVPSGEVDQSILNTVAESTTRKRLEVGGGGLTEGKVDEERRAFDVCAGNKAPVAAVAAVIAVVAEYEVVAGWHTQVRVLDKAAHLGAPVGVYAGIVGGVARELIA